MILVCTPPQHLVYHYSPQTKSAYAIDLIVDGFLPVLGGQQGKAEVKLGMDVTGGAPTSDGMIAIHQLNDASIFFQDKKLPLSFESFTDFFPKTTVTLTSEGNVVKNDAPDKELLVKVPGLDAKRLADVTFLPIQFPKAELLPGSSWSFSKSVSGSEMKFDCTLEGIDSGVARVKVATKQGLKYMESESLEVVKDAADAVHNISADSAGTGEILFDVSRGEVTSVHMNSATDTTVEDIKTHVVTHRNMTSAMTVVLVSKTTEPTVSVHRQPRPVPQWQALGRQLQDWGVTMVNNPSIVGGFVRRLFSQIFLAFGSLFGS